MIQRTLNIQTGEMVDVETYPVGNTFPQRHAGLPEYSTPTPGWGSALGWGCALFLCIVCVLCLVIFGLNFISLFY